MALQGTYNRKEYRNSLTETIEVIEPDGTTSTQPAIEEYTAESFTDCYVKVVSVNAIKRDTGTELLVNYYIYEDKANADAGTPEDNLLHNDMIAHVPVTDTESKGNLFERAYVKMKTYDKFSGFSDV